MDFIVFGDGQKRVVQCIEKWHEHPENIREIWSLFNDWYLHNDKMANLNVIKPGYLTPDHAREEIPGKAMELMSKTRESPDSTSYLSLLCVLVEAMPIQLQSTNKRPDPLFNGHLIMARRGRAPSRKGNAVSWERMPKHDGSFPGFGLRKKEGDVIPALPEELHRLPQRTRGKGAPLVRRIFVNAILDLPQDDWCHGSEVYLPEKPLSEFLGTLYPNPRGWRKSNDLDHLIEAFELLDHRDARVEFEDPTTGRTMARRVVRLRDIPKKGHPDDSIQMIVDLPPGCESGAIFDRLALLKTGTRSAPAYDLSTSLAVWWYRPGLTRIPVDKGRHYIQATHRKPYEMPDHVLYAMCYPGGEYPNRYKETSLMALQFLQSIGYASVVEEGGKWFVLPGEKWIGWAK